jgi:hypothetical protein
MATTIPVTLSGFYEEQEGGYRYYWWEQGQLKCGGHVFRHLGTARLVRTLEELESRNYPSYLRALGYTATEMAKAVQEGEARWVHDGRLDPTHGTRTV